MPWKAKPKASRRDSYIIFLSLCCNILIIFMGKKRKVSLEVPTQEEGTGRDCGIMFYAVLEAAFCTPVTHWLQVAHGGQAKESNFL